MRLGNARTAILFLQCLLTALLMVAVGLPAQAAVEVNAARLVIVETDTGSLLSVKGEDEPFAPGNFAKLMTAAVVFEALAAGEITEETTYKVSEDAWRTGGAPAKVTTMFAAVRSEIPVGDLLKGLIVHYGNDAALVIAEGLTGSETVFAQRMNALAEKIGMTSSRFVNATGYADKRARVTLMDLIKLIDFIRLKHPERYKLYALQDFTWNKIAQRNKTEFVLEMKGAEGLVMAHDETAGFGAAVSVVRDGRRILVIASGFRSEDQRSSDIRALVDSAYRDYTLVPLFEPGETVAEVRVFGGTSLRVPVTGAGPVAVTLPAGDRDGFRLRVVYEGPVPAPVTRGQQIAGLEVRRGDRIYQTLPLVAAEDVAAGDLLARARDGLSELVFGWW